MPDQEPFFSTWSPGKLMISGEYLVMHGATALMVPMVKGSGLKVFRSNQEKHLQWKSSFLGREWFSANYSCSSLEILSTSDPQRAEFIGRILRNAKEINPEFAISPDLRIISDMTIDPFWGWGSSASLLVNIARWAGVDPWSLHDKTVNGSGADLACVLENRPILYSRSSKSEAPHIRAVDLKWEFVNQLFLLYSGKKKNSEEAVQWALRTKPVASMLFEISRLSQELTEAASWDSFIDLISKAGQTTMGYLGAGLPEDLRDLEFDGLIKPLGAWGGDFVLVASYLKWEELQDIFMKKGFPVLLRWNEWVGFPKGGGLS